MVATALHLRSTRLAMLSEIARTHLAIVYRQNRRILETTAGEWYSAGLLGVHPAVPKRGLRRVVVDAVALAANFPLVLAVHNNHVPRARNSLDKCDDGASIR